MAKLLLDTAAVEEDFFEDCKLAAIGSALPGYSLCWTLNRLFGLDFRRTPENDICILAGETQASGKGTLFEGTLFGQLKEEEEVKRKFYFPIYCHKFSYFEGCIFLYKNQRQGKKLVPELKHADYLLLMQYASFVAPENDLLPMLSQVEHISWNSEIDIDILRSKRNLII
jgi:hypothetical protein